MGEIILQESVLRKHYSPRCYMGDINIVHPKSTQINDALMLKTGWRMENDCLNQEFYNIMNHNGNNKSLKVVLEKKNLRTELLTLLTPALPLIKNINRN